MADKDKIPKSWKEPKAYEIELVKNLYIFGDKPLEHWVTELGISKAALDRVTNVGGVDWHSLREEFQEKRMKYFKSASKDLLVERQSLAYRIEMLTILALHHRVNEIEAHYKSYGDFYARNDEGGFLLDGKGQKIMLALPNTSREYMALSGIEHIRVTNERLLAERTQTDADKKRTIETKQSVAGLFEPEIDKEDD